MSQRLSHALGLVSLRERLPLVKRDMSIRRGPTVERRPGLVCRRLSRKMDSSWYRHEDEFLTAAPETSTLYDFGQSCERLKRLKPFPPGRGALIALPVSAALPILPVILAVVPSPLF
jgi:hypothetical protein